jgi:acetoin utilization deacetylase AcuC-like enzyme
MPLIWSPDYEVDIGIHVFPTAKYRLVLDALLEAGTIEKADLLSAHSAPWEWIEAVHSSDYVEKVRTGNLSFHDVLTLELPYSTPLQQASLLCCGGTTLTARMALAENVAAHLGGGFHHAFRGHGEGFCLLNDVAVALVHLLEAGEVERCAVVDLDVHHGNGTASIFRDDPRVFTMSMHQERNYPSPKPPSDLDLGLDDGIRDDEYLRKLGTALDVVLSRQRPELVIYLAGADPFVEDQLGGLALTRKGLEERDRMVLETCVSAGVPTAVVLAGGYARRVEDTVAIHRQTIEVAMEVWESKPSAPGDRESKGSRRS